MISALLLPAAVLRTGTKVAFGIEEDPGAAALEEAKSASLALAADRVAAAEGRRFFTAATTEVFAPLVLPAAFR